MPQTEQARQRYLAELQQLGKKGINAAFPNDFEYYFMAFELVNSDDETVDYFAFPILPQNFNETKTEIKNIKKSAGGITVLKTSTFVPRQITMEGDFGRKFKILQGENVSDLFSAISFSLKNGVFSKESLSNIVTTIKSSVFEPGVKTGYGCIKILEAIVDKANGLDNKNNPYRLYFYNHALGNNYLVEPTSISFSQDEQKTQIWSYSLQMTAIARLEDLENFDDLSLLRNLGFDWINKKIQKQFNKVKSNVYSGEVGNKVTGFVENAGQAVSSTVSSIF